VATIEELEKRIKKLEKRAEELERRCERILYKSSPAIGIPLPREEGDPPIVYDAQQ
jgi:hypothetical protein